MRLFSSNDKGEQEGHDDLRRDSIIATTLAIAIVILLVTFVVLFIGIDPLLSDFRSSGAMTPDTGSPAVGTPAISPTP